MVPARHTTPGCERSPTPRTHVSWAKGVAKVQTPKGSPCLGLGDRASEGPAADPGPRDLVTASVPHGASRCSTPGTGNRKRRAAAGQLLLPLDPAAGDHGTFSPPFPSLTILDADWTVSWASGSSLVLSTPITIEIFKFSSTFSGCLSTNGSQSPASGLLRWGGVGVGGTRGRGWGGKTRSSLVTCGHARSHALPASGWVCLKKARVRAEAEVL